MFTNLRRTCVFHIKNNITYYVLILCGFVCGGIIAAACVLGLSELSFKELSIYFDDFFNSINSGGSDAFGIFKIAALSNLKLYIILILLSVMFIGLPLIVVLSVWVGYSFWFSMFFVFKIYGIKGIVFALGGILPLQLSLLPCLSLTFVICMQFSASLFKGKTDVKSSLSSFLLKMTLLFLVSMLSVLLEAYIEPIFMELMSSLYIG